MEELFLALPLSKPKRNRTNVLSIERLPAGGEALRPKRHKFPRRRLHCCSRQLLVMSLDPKSAEPCLVTSPAANGLYSQIYDIDLHS
jgi:hypothetical protein